MASATAAVKTKNTAFEYLLSNGGPYECLVAILRHLNHEDVHNLLLVPSKAIRQNVVLAKVAADREYNGLLQGRCQYPIFDYYKQIGVCSNSLQNSFDVRMCQTHNGQNFSVCSIHAGPEPKELDQLEAYGFTCADCIVRVSKQILDQEYEFCKCLKEIDAAQKLWSCKLCWRYLTLRTRRIGSGERCDACFPSLDDFQSHYIISTAPRLDHCLSTLDQTRGVCFELACLKKHKRYSLISATAYICQCCNEHIGHEFFFMGACYTTYLEIQFAPFNEVEKKAKEFGGSFAWCERCRKLRGDPWAGKSLRYDICVRCANLQDVLVQC